MHEHGSSCKTHPPHLQIWPAAYNWLPAFSLPGIPWPFSALISSPFLKNCPKIWSLSTCCLSNCSCARCHRIYLGLNTSSQHVRSLWVPYTLCYSREAAWDLWLLRSATLILPIWIVMQPHQGQKQLCHWPVGVEMDSKSTQAQIASTIAFYPRYPLSASWRLWGCSLQLNTKRIFPLKPKCMTFIPIMIGLVWSGAMHRGNSPGPRRKTHSLLKENIILGPQHWRGS